MNRKYLSPKIRSAHFETESESIFIDLVRGLFPTLSMLAISKLSKNSVLGDIVSIAYAVIMAKPSRRRSDGRSYLTDRS